MASLMHRHEMTEAEDYDGGSKGSNGDGSAADSATEEEEGHRLDLGLDSMTAKGIQHLCSELLEIKKASEQDFRANVYLSCLSFIRMFQEAGALEKDLHQHVLAHRRLVQNLSNNYLYSSPILCGTAIPIPIAVDDHHHEDELELELELDVLLSEHRMEEALELLELQGQALQRITSTEAMVSSMSALSARKARVAHHLASVADNPRTPRPELLKALSGLCKLGDAQRANHLLFKFFRPAAAAAASQPFLKNSSNYIKDLACIVFSSIVEASRSFMSLHGYPSPHTHQLIRWVREEMEDFSVAFSEYVKVDQSMVLALEAAKCALSYCYLLKPLHVIVSEQDLLDLITPCLQEVLTMYARHLKEVTQLFVASDTWVLGRFPVSGILLVRRTMEEAGLQIDYCLLTASGRKFLTLIQDVVEDVYPLSDLRINNSVLQLLAQLFREYMHSIVELIAKKQNEDHQYMWQLSILINCTTLLSLFPIIAHRMFKSDQPSVATDFLTPGERDLVDSLILLIKQAAGKVWTCFCQQFIRDTMSCLQNSGQEMASSPQGMMPSFPFQVLFGRVRQLNNLYGTILTGKDGVMKKLLQELIEAMISWLSNNLDSWIHHAQGIPRDTLYQQIQLDVHFLLEFVQLAGFSSETITTGALDLLTKAEEKVAYCSEHDHRNSSAREGWDWATVAAKHAIGVLSAIRPGPHQHKSVQNVVDAQEEAEETDQDLVESFQEGQMDAPDEREACDGGKSSDEFISIEEEEESILSEEELKLGLGISREATLDEYSEIEEERTISNHCEAADDAGGDDHDSGSGENPPGILHAIEVKEDSITGDHGDNSCELVLQDKNQIQEMVGGGRGSSESRRRRQASSRRKREPASNRPRWQ